MKKNPYRLADAAIKQFNRFFITTAGEVKQSILRFDEVNSLKAIDSLYKRIDRRIRKMLKRLYEDRFLEMLIFLASQGDTEAERIVREVLGMTVENAVKRDPENIPRSAKIRELIGSDKAVKEILDEPNDVLHYSYDTELIRKRDRLKEAVLSSPTRTQRQLEAEKAIRQVTQMTGWFTDITSQTAEKKAMEETGVKKVRWNIYGDDKVCATCSSMDGNVYPIDQVPSRPHPHCRCYLTPAE